LTEPELLVEVQGPVASLTLNRPAQRNALSRGMLQGLKQFFDETVSKSDSRVVILRGAGGKAFSSGSDFADLRQALERGILPSGPEDPFEHALAALVACPLPVIALVEGFAVGGGCALAAACDIRIASESARLGMPPAKLGLLYSHRELRPFVDLIGPGRTKLLFFSGRLFSAAEALRFGLVDEVVQDDQVRPYAYGLADDIASNAPLTIRNTKRILGHLAHHPLSEAQETEIVELLRQTQASEDFQEGQRAVLEKRPPSFKGR
jgi:enoyl-CoA hydratase/carnithine racemase